MNARAVLPNTIVIKLQGGLGNQLFQYALGRNLQHTQGFEVQYDGSWFATQSKRKYELGAFRTNVRVAAPETAKRFQRYGPKLGMFRFFHNALRTDPSLYITERSLTFDPRVLDTKPPAYLDGHWQSEKYFRSIAELLRAELHPRTPPSGENPRMLKEIERQNSVSVHVRRGDYVEDARTNRFHGTPGVDYYQRATRYLAERLQKTVFYVFSDDSDWVRRTLEFPAPSVVISHNGSAQAHEDLRLMRACHHHILANSTFSWWGAWLGEAKGRVIVAPKRWFKNDVDAKDLIPSRWLRL